MQRIKKLIKELIQTQKKKIDLKLNEWFLRLIDKLTARALTTVGLLIREIRSECYISENISILDREKYIKRLYEFYNGEFEAKCLNSDLNYIQELLLRRKELKNKAYFLANVGIAIFTGVLTGLFVNNINKFTYIFNVYGLNDSFLISIFRFIAMLFILIFVVFIPILLIIIFKSFITIFDPIIDYLEELEVKIIEAIIKDKFKLTF